MLPLFYVKNLYLSDDSCFTESDGFFLYDKKKFPTYQLIREVWLYKGGDIHKFESGLNKILCLP